MVDDLSDRLWATLTTLIAGLSIWAIARGENALDVGGNQSVVPSQGTSAYGTKQTNSMRPGDVR